MRYSRLTDGCKHSDIREWTLYIESKEAINLAQGICFVELSSETEIAIDAACDAARAGKHKRGFNTYSHYSGIEALRAVIAAKARWFNNMDVSPDDNVIITIGASGAMTHALTAIVEPGEEVIVFEPFYTYHVALLAIKGIGRRVVRLCGPSRSFTPEDLENAWSPGVKAIIVNTPSNPSGKVFTREELGWIADFCIKHDVAAITDEVYEFMVYGDNEHISLATLPGMWERTVTIASFSKPLALTGWRVGYAIATKETIDRMGFGNEYQDVCAPMPFQHAIASAFVDWRRFLGLKDVYQKKRDILCDGLRRGGFPIIVPEGAIYVMADVSSLGQPNDVAVNHWLIEKPKVGGVPGHDFYSDAPPRQQIRFCFATEDTLLEEAGRRFAAIGEWHGFHDRDFGG